MKPFSTSIFALILAASGAAMAQTSNDREVNDRGSQAQGASRDAGADTSSGASTPGSGESGSPAAPLSGHRELGTNVRGAPESSSTSDRETSRTWTGLGSTGGSTGTGTSSGTSDAEATAASGGATDTTPGERNEASTEASTTKPPAQLGR